MDARRIEILEFLPELTKGKESWGGGFILIYFILKFFPTELQ